MTQKEMEASIRESVARAEAARAGVEVARAGVEVAREGIEVARRKQEEAVARQEAATAKLEEQWAKADARWQEERVWMREFGERQEESARKTDEILAELKDGRDERRAMLEALFRVMDRLPPPPPNLRSA